MSTLKVPTIDLEIPLIEIYHQKGVLLKLF